MAKPKKSSMLSRQRQLRAQQQQVKQASQNNLPPRGGSSGGNGGAVVRRPNNLPTQRGGPMTQSPRGQTTSARVDPARIKDLGTVKVPNSGRPQLGGASPSRPTPPNALPAGRAGGSLAIRANRPGATAAVAEAGSYLVDAAAKSLVNAYGRAINRERSQRAAESGQRGRYAPGNQQVKFEKPEQPKKPADKKPAASTPNRGSSTPQRSGPSARITNPAPKAATKAPAKKPMEKAYGESGKDLYMASKKNNPLMKRTFGYQTGDAPDQKKKKS
jgi:hypothetical protein